MTLSLAHGDEPCEIGSLVEEQTEAFELLENFANIADDDFDAALEALWFAGQDLQHMAEECGFIPPEETEEVVEQEMDMTAEEMADHEMVEIPDEEAVMEFAMSIGDPENGAVLFLTFTETGFACATCHHTDSTDRLVGPGLLGVAYAEHLHDDATVMDEMDGEADDHEHATAEADAIELPFELEDDPLISRETLEYIYTSIIDPGAVVVEGYPDNLMPRTFEDIFTEEELADIIAYLVTLTPTVEE
jgi:mono/diheme cytochrome c family protein